MNAADIRAEALATPLRYEPVSTPFWPKSDGSVYLQDIPADEITAMENLKKNPVNGDALYIGAILCKALVTLNESGGQPERIFQDSDREVVAKLGAGMLRPIFEQIRKLFGIEDPNATVDAAKKN